jgi:hypothetical protein
LTRCLAILALALSACGDLQGLSSRSRGVAATLSVDVQGDFTKATAGLTPDVQLRLGVFWAGLPSISKFCIEYGDYPFKPDVFTETSSIASLGCPDIRRFVFGERGPSVEFVGGRTQIELQTLPSATSLYGGPLGRVGYASIVLFADENGDGELDMTPRCDLSEGALPAERVLAASFSRILQPHLRLVYREGEDVDAELFYPEPACDLGSSPLGFSWLDVGNTDCSSIPSTDAVRLTLTSTDSLQGFLCPRFEDAQILRPPVEIPQGRLHTDCLNSERLVVIATDCECPQAKVFDLRCGEDSADCGDAWDLRSSPPSWWPCTEEDDP